MDQVTATSSVAKTAETPTTTAQAKGMTAGRQLDVEAKSTLSPEMLEVLGVEVEEETTSDKSEAITEKVTSENDNEDADRFFDELLGEDAEKNKEESETDNQETESEAELYKLIHEGKEVSVPKGEMMELAQKGYDYTQKTMALADGRKALEEEKRSYQIEAQKAYQDIEKRYAEQDKQLNMLKMWDTTIEAMKVEDPDLFNQVRDYSQRSSVRFNNPLLQNEIKAIREELAQYKNQGKVATNNSIVENYNKELNSFQEQIKPILTKLNFVPDWKKVQDMWTSVDDDAMDVKRAFYAVYGDDIMKLNKSKEALMQTKTAAKKPSFRGTAKAVPQENNLRGLSYSEITRNLLSRLGN